MKEVSRRIEQKLGLQVAAGLIIFAIVAGLACTAFVYHYQLQASRALQAQLVDTVRAQAEVAVFAQNQEIARGVIDGLLANPLLLSVRISGQQSFLSAGGSTQPGSTPGARTRYVLLSPVDHRTPIGEIEVVMDDAVVAQQALTSTVLLLTVIGLQVLLAAILITGMSRRLVISPIAALARHMADYRPGSGVRLAIDARHGDDEIGQLAWSANALIEAHELALAELRELATMDALTGVSNRRHFIARLEDELARLQRQESLQATVLMLDIDHFKHINDTWGHAAGDSALHQLGSILRGNARKIDAVGRLGGEEFALLLVGADVAEGQGLAERLRRIVADTPITFDGQQIRMTLSIGLSALQPTDPGAQAALARADQALYLAKQQGRNRVVAAGTCQPA